MEKSNKKTTIKNLIIVSALALGFSTGSLLSTMEYRDKLEESKEIRDTQKELISATQNSPEYKKFVFERVHQLEQDFVDNNISADVYKNSLKQIYSDQEACEYIKENDNKIYEQYMNLRNEQESLIVPTLINTFTCGFSSTGAAIFDTATIFALSSYIKNQKKERNLNKVEEKEK